jgi:hypothetical protein
VALPGLLLVLREFLRTGSVVDRIAALYCLWGWTLFTSQILLEGLAVPVMAWASRLLMIAPVPILWPPVPDVVHSGSKIVHPALRESDRDVAPRGIRRPRRGLAAPRAGFFLTGGSSNAMTRSPAS